MPSAVTAVVRNSRHNTVGSYVITYLNDASGNSGTATRTVRLIQQHRCNCNRRQSTVELGGTYTDVDTTATDASGELLLSLVVIL